jgi:DNA-directed RNA polymerase specialized sigma24 family protein
MRDAAADVAIADRVSDVEPAGYAELYDRYAAQLYAYCYSMLGDQERAIGALGMTLMIAVCRLDKLRDSGRMRPWLYALARSECRRFPKYGHAASGPVHFASADLGGVGEAGHLPHYGHSSGPWWAEDGELLTAAELGNVEILTAAMRALSVSDREAVELCLRHCLIGPDLADVLRMPTGRVHKVVLRACVRLRRALGTLLVARWGREDCPDLDGMLAGWDGRPTALVSRRVRVHIGVCETCRGRQGRELPPGALAGLLAEAPQPTLPPGLRDNVLRVLAQAAPGTGAEGDLIVDLVTRRAGSFGSSGFPASAPWRGDWRGNHGLWVAVAAVGVILAGVAIILSGAVPG